MRRLSPNAQRDRFEIKTSPAALPQLLRQGRADEFWQIDLFTTDGLSSCKGFSRCVKRYQGDYKLKSFSCWDQFLCMAFAQLTYRESLRDIEACLRAQQTKLYHLGIRGQVSRNTLAHANSVRDWRIYADFAQVLIHARPRALRGRQLRRRIGPDGLRARCHDHRFVLGTFSLGRVSQAQRSGQTAHTARPARQHPNCCDHYTWQDSRGQHSGSTASEAGRVLCNGSRLPRFRRALPNCIWLRPSLYPRQKALRFPAPLLTTSQQSDRRDLRSDRDARQSGSSPRLSREAAPHSLLRCRKPKTTLVFLTNNFSLPALTIAQLYRSRWQVELFFKWIKQHLRIKKFYGTSENALRTQIWIAISVYVLVAIVKKRLHLDRSLYSILQILSVTLFEKTPILQVLSQFDESEKMLDDGKQLILFN